jgi:thiol-disulfide isomerase/thioredoxin
MSVSLGPLAFPLAPLVWLLALALGLAVATRWARRLQGRPLAEQASWAGWQAALAGFAAARLAFVAAGWSDYAARPWSVLDIRDGGWLLLPGLLAAAAWLAWCAWRTRALARPLLAGATLTLAAWAGLGTAAGLYRALPVPDAPLVALADGREARLPALARGRPTVINLWATWCVPCRVELPALAAAQAARPDVQFLFVNQGEAAPRVQGYLQTLPFRLDGVWLDVPMKTMQLAGSKGLPTTLIYDGQGRLVHRHFGILTEAALRARLSGLR